MNKRGVLNIVKMLGLIMASSAVNFSCIMIFGQEKLPSEVKKMRRF
ncbi:cyclic lactone autoinducer peptide [Enterococcus saccharolyticus]|nr:cyclic lactone autoinducer peptide [Enterococcus saccharolyticus]MCD5003687.1 cyclic lactone autoinducer peptide [Enterococcus saccharolyticus]